MFAWSFPLLHLVACTSDEAQESIDPASPDLPGGAGPATAGPQPGPRVDQGPPPGHPERLCFDPPSEKELALWRQISAKAAGGGQPAP